MFKVGGIGRGMVLLGTLASGCGGGSDSQVALRAASQAVDTDVLIRAADKGTHYAEEVFEICRSKLNLAKPGDRLNYLECLDLPGHQASEMCDMEAGAPNCVGAFKRFMRSVRFESIYQAERTASK